MTAPSLGRPGMTAESEATVAAVRDARHPLLSFRGAPKGASPESIIPSGGYGFRAPSLRSGPGMKAETLDASE
jgi:hypothetical protein